MNAPVKDEILLVRQAQAGSRQAFGALVTAYQGFVYNLALRSLGNVQEAQDAAQETFLRAWTALPRFRGECKFSTWLYRITVNLCFNRRPRLRRELSAISVDEDFDNGVDIQVFELLEAPPTPQQTIERMELRALLHANVACLPETYRMLIALRYQQDLSYDEIAEVLNMPVGTVKTGLFRAKAQLKAAMLAHHGTQQEIAEWTN